MLEYKPQEELIALIKRQEEELARAVAAADKAARQNLARVLGLGVSAIGSFAWDYLLTLVTSAVEDQPVAQPVAGELPPLPKWIDDAKGKDPFTDDLISQIEQLITQVTEMKWRAIEAHRQCYRDMRTNPFVATLQDDGALHCAIHAIVGVDTPLCSHLQPVQQPAAVKKELPPMYGDEPKENWLVPDTVAAPAAGVQGDDELRILMAKERIKASLPLKMKIQILQNALLAIKCDYVHNSRLVTVCDMALKGIQTGMQPDSGRDAALKSVPRYVCDLRDSYGMRDDPKGAWVHLDEVLKAIAAHPANGAQAELTPRQIIDLAEKFELAFDDGKIAYGKAILAAAKKGGA